MAKKLFKKIGAKLKKFANSKVGKVLKVAVGVAGVATGLGLGVKAIKAGKIGLNLVKGAKAVKNAKAVKSVLSNVTMAKGLLTAGGGVAKGLGAETLGSGDKSTVIDKTAEFLAVMKEKDAAKEQRKLEAAANEVKAELTSGNLTTAMQSQIRSQIDGTYFGDLVRNSSGASASNASDVHAYNVEDPKAEGMKTALKVGGAVVGAGLLGWGINKLLS